MTFPAASRPPPAATEARLGGTFTITDTVGNQGNVLAGASTTRYYLSFDTLRSADDLLLAGTRPVTSLVPGGTSAGTRVVTVPLLAPAGAYYVLGCANDASKVGESDNANKGHASGTRIIVHP